MIEINSNQFKSRPFKHQMEGVKAIVKNKAFALFDEMGAGKSKQVIDAACVLAQAGEIDTVVVIAPASVRSVWIHPEIGEIRKHSWTCNTVYEYHSKSETIWEDEGPATQLSWLITNYEFLRQENRLTELIKRLINRNVMLVLDESSYVKNRTAQQSKALYKLRQNCARCVLLNGTPVTDNPLDLWSQFRILDERILFSKYKNFYHFRAHYAVMGGWKMKQVIQWVNLKQLSSLLKPWVLRRLKKDCLDLPDKLFTVREVALEPATWARYRELKKEAVMSLPEGEMLLEPNAAVRVMRLSQITSGHIGLGSSISLTAQGKPLNNNEPIFMGGMEDLSSEKLDWCVKYLTEECQARYVIVWCRWRRERERLAEMMNKFSVINGTPTWVIEQLYGGQSKELRERAVNTFSIADAKYLRYVLLAQPHAGGHGLNLIAATEVIYLSNDWSLGIRLQSEDRCHRPGQKNPVTYIDVLATGPKGQKSIDHIVHKALIRKEELARLTTSAWRAELEEDNW